MCEDAFRGQRSTLAIISWVLTTLFFKIRSFIALKLDKQAVLAPQRAHKVSSVLGLQVCLNAQLFCFFKWFIILFIILCMSLCTATYVLAPTEARRVHQILLELGLMALVRQMNMDVGTELQAFARTVCALNH